MTLSLQARFQNSFLSPPPSPTNKVNPYTGGSAFAAGELIEKCGGKVLEYLFIIELEFLKGAAKLNAPTWSIVKD